MCFETHVLQMPSTFRKLTNDFSCRCPQAISQILAGGTKHNHDFLTLERSVSFPFRSCERAADLTYTHCKHSARARHECLCVCAAHGKHHFCKQIFFEGGNLQSKCTWVLQMKCNNLVWDPIGVLHVSVCSFCSVCWVCRGKVIASTS